MPRPILLLGAIALATAGGCASLAMPTWPGSKPAPPGTKAWWKSHKKEAELVPEHGYRVTGVDGYFDQEGRPINAKIAKVVDDKKSTGLIDDVDFMKTVSGIKESVGLGPDHQKAELAYSLAEAHFRYQKYAEAAKEYKEAAKEWPDSQLEQDAWFKLGESYFYGDQYPKAVDAYEKLIKKYPNSRYLDKIIGRQFAIARYWEQYDTYDHHWLLTPNLIAKDRPLFDTIGRSMKTYTNIRLDDPTGPLADDAVMATANAYFLRGRYQDADEQYDTLRKDYPRSEHQYDAHVLGLQCKLREYQGPDYDVTPMEEAQKLVKQMRSQFAGKLDADQKKRLSDVDAQIAKELSDRDFQMAQRYEKIQEYGSARFYYAKVMKDHPQTQMADQSRERLIAMGALPDRPTSKVEWLLDLVPQNAERKAVAQVPMVQGENPTELARGSSETQTASKNADATSDPTTRR